MNPNPSSYKELLKNFQTKISEIETQAQRYSNSFKYLSDGQRYKIIYEYLMRLESMITTVDEQVFQAVEGICGKKGTINDIPKTVIEDLTKIQDKILLKVVGLVDKSNSSLNKFKQEVEIAEKLNQRICTKDPITFQKLKYLRKQLNQIESIEQQIKKLLIEFHKIELSEQMSFNQIYATTLNYENQFFKWLDFKNSARCEKDTLHNLKEAISRIAKLKVTRLDKEIYRTINDIKKSEWESFEVRKSFYMACLDSIKNLVIMSRQHPNLKLERANDYLQVLREGFDVTRDPNFIDVISDFSKAFAIQDDKVKKYVEREGQAFEKFNKRKRRELSFSDNLTFFEPTEHVSDGKEQDGNIVTINTSLEPLALRIKKLSKVQQGFVNILDPLGLDSKTISRTFIGVLYLGLTYAFQKRNIMHRHIMCYELITHAYRTYKESSLVNSDMLQKIIEEKNNIFKAKETLITQYKYFSPSHNIDAIRKYTGIQIPYELFQNVLIDVVMQLECYIGEKETDKCILEIHSEWIEQMASRNLIDVGFIEKFKSAFSQKEVIENKVTRSSM